MLFEEKHSKSNYFHTIDFMNLYSVPHCHKSFEILFVREGVVKTTVHDTVYEITSGNGILILPYEIHSYETISPSKNFITIFSIDFLPDFYEIIKDKSLHNPVLQYTEEKLTVLHHKEEVFSMKSVLYYYASKVLQNGTSTNISVTGNDLMCKILFYIQENYKSSISLKALSNELGYSYSYLSSYFNKYFHIGFSEYVNLFRLEEAAQLLKNTDMTITQVALSCGFSTIRNFNLAFQKKYHMTPNEWIRQNSIHSSKQV